MDEQLKTKLMTYLDGLEKAAQKVGDVAATEVPATVQEWLQWRMWESFLSCGVWLVAAVLSAALLYSLVKWAKSIIKKDPELPDPIIVFPVVASVLASVLFLHSIYWSASSFRDGIKCVVAPRVVILEKIVELTKSK